MGQHASGGNAASGEPRAEGRARARAPGPAPTTRSQVTGHRFLSRRVRHGLVFGDIRMIHDPLGRRRRAAIFGFVAAALCAGCAGLMAVIDPAPDPGDAAILEAESGALYVRVGEEVHPVANLASARLIVGSPDKPAKVSAEHLSMVRLGLPVGIEQAPGALARDAPDQERSWYACLGEDAEVTVAFTAHARVLPDSEAVLARVDDGPDAGEWLMTSQGRWRLPGGESAGGRVLRRRVGAGGQAPVWRAPSDVVSASPELGVFELPEPLPTVVETGGEYWARGPEQVVGITAFQAEVLADAGASRESAGEGARAELAAQATGVPLRLPESAPRIVAPTGSLVCTGPAGRALATVATPEARIGPDSDQGTEPAAAQSTRRGRAGVERKGEAPKPQAPGLVDTRVPLPDGGLARWFVGPQEGAFAVDTGAGVQVLTDSGLRHRLDAPETAAALGLPEAVPAWWPVLRLLPEGPGLGAAEARAVSSVGAAS